MLTWNQQFKSTCFVVFFCFVLICRSDANFNAHFILSNCACRAVAGSASDVGGRVTGPVCPGPPVYWTRSNTNGFRSKSMMHGALGLDSLSLLRECSCTIRAFWNILASFPGSCAWAEHHSLGTRLETYQKKEHYRKADLAEIIQHACPPTILQVFMSFLFLGEKRIDVCRMLPVHFIVIYSVQLVHVHGLSSKGGFIQPPSNPLPTGLCYHTRRRG